MRPTSSWFGRLLIGLAVAAFAGAPVVFATTPNGVSRAQHVAVRAPLPACTIVGTPGDDAIVGTPGDDVICARGGDDMVRGGGGNDVIFGGVGRDRLLGGRGDDRLYGGLGDDQLFGAHGRDYLQGAGGSDLISGGRDEDTVDYSLRGRAVRVSIGAGADDGAAGEGDDVRGDVERVLGGAGNDVLSGNDGRDDLSGGPGDDVLRGGRGDDQLSGGGGRDRLDGRDGAGYVDRLSCGDSGDDTALADRGDQLARDCERVRWRGPRNHAPSDILLSNRSVAENQPAGTSVGALSAVDRDRRDRHVFALVSGAGSADNRSFRIDGSTLKTSAVFDFEAKNSYSVRVRATDRRGASFAKSFRIAVTDLPEHVNRPPTAISLSNSSVDENEPVGTTVGALNATDPDAGDTHTFALVSGTGDADNGAFTVAGSSLRTAAVLDFETQASYSIRVRATDDGTPAMSAESVFTITVNDTSEPPTITTTVAPLPYTEDAPPTIVDGALTVSDPDDTNLEGATVLVSTGFDVGDELLFTDQSGINGAYDAATGVLTLTGTSSVANYQTALRSVQYRTTNDNPATAKTVKFVANDGTNTGSATRNITVTPLNDPPTLDTTNAALAYPEGAGPVAADPGITVSDPDSLQIKGATVQITSNFASAQDELAFTNQLGITGSYDDTTGTLTLIGTTSGENYQAALRAVTYENSSQNPSPPGRTLTFRATDAEGATSAAATRDITLSPMNNAATITTTASALAYTEGAAATAVDPGLTVNDPDDTNLEGAAVRISAGYNSGDELLFTNQNGITGSYDVGSRTLTLTGTSSLANYQTALRSVQFRTTNDNPATVKTVEFRADDGDGLGPPSTRNIDVTPVDDPPVAVDDTAPVAEDSGANAIAVLANDTDPDGGLITIASATDPANGTVVLTGGLPGAHTGLTYQPDPDYCNDPPGTTPDTFTYTVNGGSTATVGVTVTCADDPPTAVNDSATVGEDSGASAIAVLANDTDGDGGPKTIASATDPANGTVVLTGGSPGAHTGLTYQPDPDYCNDPPGTTPDTFTYALNGGSTATVSVTVTCVDDPPTAVNDSATVGEDSGANAIAVLTNDTDTDGGPKTIASATDPANGTVVLTGGSPGAHAGLTYQPDPNYCNDPPGTTKDTFTYTLTGGSTATVSITVTCVNDAPVADDETFNGAIGNSTLAVNAPDDGAPPTPDPTDTAPVTDRPHKTISGDILAGDSDADGPGPLTVVPGTFATNDGGTVTLQADGDFTFEPAPSTSCTDTSDFFDYTVSDQNATGPGPTPGTDTGRVTLNISGCVWYVNNDDAQGNSGTSEKPFDTLAQAETASRAGDTIFVYDGNNTTSGYSTGFNLKANQRLIGEAATLTVGSDTLHTADAANKPTITDNNADVIDLDDGNEVRGLNVDPQGTGGGIAGSAGDTGGGTIDDVDVVDTGTAGTQPGLELDGTAGTFNVSNFSVSTNGATGVRLNNAGTVSFASSGTISITTAGAKGLDATGTSMGTSVFDAITVTGSGSGGVSLTNTTGTTTFGDLALTTTSGVAPAFLLSNAGSVSVPSAGTANVRATGGPAVDVTGTSGATLAFDDVDSTNSANDGINLAGLGAGTFSATSGDIVGAAGIAFDLDGGSGTISYPGTIGNGTGESVEITNRNGGTATVSGAITDSSDAGGGVNLAGNTGGTMDLTGGMTLSTGASTALNATGGGTFSVTGTANTLATTTGTAVNVANTTIGANDLNFRSIASNGATNGIALNNTGSTGGLTVTGNAGACTSAATCTGGAIQNSTGAGVNLTNVGGGVSLTRMSVNNGADDGIRGSSVSGLSLANSVVLNNGDAVGERGIDMTELSGSGGLSATTVSGSSESNVTIANDTATLNAFDVTGSTIANTNMTTGDDGILVLDTGSAAMTVSVTGSTFTDNKGDHFQAASDASSTGSIDVTFDNNTLTTTAANDPNVVGGGITLNPGSSNDLSFKVRNNNIQQAFDDAINLNLDPSSTSAGSLVGTISGNTIGTAGQAGSGSESSNTITLRAAGAGSSRVAIQNNTIREWTNANGISIASAEGSADIDATVTGNSIKNPDPTLGLNGIRVDAGATAGPPADDGTICAALTGNDATGSSTVGNSDIRLRQRFATTIRLPGYGGANNDSAAVNAFVSANNTGAPTVTSAFNVPGGGGFVGGAACALPPS